MLHSTLGISACLLLGVICLVTTEEVTTTAVVNNTSGTEQQQQPSGYNSTTAATVVLPCNDCSHPPPVVSTSRLLQGSASRTLSNSSEESSSQPQLRPLSQTAKFSPSPFLGAIAEDSGSGSRPGAVAGGSSRGEPHLLAVGEVFPDSLIVPGHLQQQAARSKASNSIVFPRHGVPPTTAFGAESSFRPGTADGLSRGEPQPLAGPPSSPVTGYPSGASSALDLAPPPAGDLRSSYYPAPPAGNYQKSLAAYASQDIPPVVKFNNKPVGGDGRTGGGQPGYRGQESLLGGTELEGKAGRHQASSDFGYPPYQNTPGTASGNSLLDYSTIQTNKHQTGDYYKNYYKPSKQGSGPYFFEDNFSEKPIQEYNGEEVDHKVPFPPAGPGGVGIGGGGGVGGGGFGGGGLVPPGGPHHHGGDYLDHRGGGSGGKWKKLLRFLTTVLPIGLLFAALTPNVLVVSPTQSTSTTGAGGGSSTGKGGILTGQRSLEAPLGVCGLRRLCEALAESPTDFDQFLKAVQQQGHIKAMLNRRKVLQSISSWKTSSRGIKVCVLGAMGGVGQFLSLLLKSSSWFDDIALYDLKNCRGLALELSQVDTASNVTGHDSIKEALKSSNIVLNVAGTNLRVGMNPDDFFAINAKAVVETSKECAVHCPKAFHVVATNPVNSTVPIVYEVYKKMLGCIEPGRIFGLMGVDVLRSCSIVAEVTHSRPEMVRVPVIGGHSSTTTVPILSHVQPSLKLTTDETVRVTRAVQSASADVLKAKEGTGSSVMVEAVALQRFAEDLAKGMSGQRNIVTSAYIMSTLIPDLTYFGSPVELGPAGLQKILPLPMPLSHFECCLLESAVETIKKDIDKGLKYVQGLST